MATGWIYDERFKLHDTGPGHPESSRRLEVIIRRLQETGLLDRLENVPFDPLSVAGVTTVHRLNMVGRIQTMCEEGGGMLDGDTPVSAESYDAALLAAGGTVAAVEAVMTGAVDNAFACVRPPGHHAEPEVPMGFCLFNNVAIAAKHVLLHHGLQRVLIIDWDAHHGNGTQRTFYQNPHVLYFSVHQYPFYPGSGAASETGEGEAKGTTLNVPLVGGAGDDAFVRAIEYELGRAMESFQPEFILLSAGFDAHHRDPLTGLQVTDEGYIRAGLAIKGMADQYCRGRWVSVLEGGYEAEALATGVENLVKIKLGDIKES